MQKPSSVLLIRCQRLESSGPLSGLAMGERSRSSSKSIYLIILFKRRKSVILKLIIRRGWLSFQFPLAPFSSLLFLLLIRSYYCLWVRTVHFRALNDWGQRKNLFETSESCCFSRWLAVRGHRRSRGRKSRWRTASNNTMDCMTSKTLWSDSLWLSSTYPSSSLDTTIPDREYLFNTLYYGQLITSSVLGSLFAPSTDPIWCNWVTR